MRRARILLAIGQRIAPRLCATHAHSRVVVVPRGFGAIVFITYVKK